MNVKTLLMSILAISNADRSDVSRCTELNFMVRIIHVCHAFNFVNICLLLLLPSNQNNSKCEHSIQAAALQGSESCKLFNTIINNDNILSGDVSDVDGTCNRGSSVENVDKPRCVQGVSIYLFYICVR